MAYFVDPQVNAEGQFIGASVTNPAEGYGRNSEADYVEIQGQTHHVMEDVEIPDEELDYLTDYYDTLANSIPDVHEALAWAADFLPKDSIIAYNNALDNNDLEAVNQTLQYIVDSYHQAGDVPFTDEDSNSEEESIEDDWSEEDQEELSNILEELTGNEPQGEQVANYWQEWSNEAAANGNEVAAGIGAAVAAFNQGEVDAETAIQFVLENYNIRDVEAVYRHITQQV